MRRIDISFLVLATVSLLIGSGLGLWMGSLHDFRFSPAYTNVVLVGWTSLALFGLCYRVYPNLAASRIAIPQFFLASLSAILFPLGIALSIADVTPSVAFAGSLLWLTSVVLFLLNLLRLALAEIKGPLHPSLSLGQNPPAARVAPAFGRWRETLES
jgi:hypothetical protein